MIMPVLFFCPKQYLTTTKSNKIWHSILSNRQKVLTLQPVNVLYKDCF